MGWGTLALFFVSLFMTILLRPTPKIEGARVTELDESSLPIADEGSPIPLVYGRVELKSPNCIWYGNYFAVKNLKAVDQGFKEDAIVIQSYSYALGVDMALCLGPDVTCHFVIANDKFVDQIENTTAVASFSLYRPQIFGGVTAAGGIIGDGTFYSGEVGQPIDAYVESIVQDNETGDPTELVPGYTGIAHIVFERTIWGTSPSMPALSFVVSRYTNTLGLSAAQNLIGTDDRELNPAEALYDLLTNGFGGAGLATSDIDTASFTAAATVLALENNGISLVISSPNDAKAVVQEILRQIDGILYQEPDTAKIVLKLIRDDYTLSATPLFNESNVLEVKTLASTSWQDTYNQVRLTYFERKSNGDKKTTTMVQDMANIGMQGGKVRSIDVTYPGVYDPPNANQIATRELSLYSVPLLKATITANRDGASLRPGDVFRLSWEEYGIVSLPVRVNRINFGSLVDGKIVLDVVQDRFAVDDVVYADQESTLWNDIDRPAVDVGNLTIFESPFYFINQAKEGAADTSAYDFSSWWLLATSPAYMLGYNGITASDSALTVDRVTDLPEVPIPAKCVLDETILPTDGFATAVIADVEITGLNDATILEDSDDDGVREGKNLLYCNGEIFGYESFTVDVFDSDFVTLHNVRRALLDTTFQTWTSGDTAFFLPAATWRTNERRVDNFVGTPLTEYFAKLQTFSDTDIQDEDDLTATSFWKETPASRYNAPMPPVYITAAGSRTPAPVTGAPVLIAWRNRNRPDSFVRLYGDATRTLEGGQTTTLRWKIDAGAWTTVTGLTGTSQLISPGAPGTITVEIWSVLNSNASRVTASIAFDFTP